MCSNSTPSKAKMFKLLLVFIVVAAAGVNADPLLVTLPNGQIRGQELVSESKNIYYAFQEIPYASPPVGELRYKEPEAAHNWEGVLDATKNTKICYQQMSTLFIPNVTETEDCLYLNVYTPVKPDATEQELLPVFFWIHGGAFTSGSGTFQSYGPGYLMDYNIVVVTINYRLGPFGFLTTEDGVIPANLGLKDQNFALKWTNQNIKLFGGDPEKVTIAGESAGASSVGHLLISKESSELFRAAVLESGTSIASWSRQLFAKHYAFQMGSALDPAFNSDKISEDLLQLLKTAAAEDIINANVTVEPGKGISLGPVQSLIWAPVIENENLQNALVVGPMEENVKNGNINRVPILIGYNSEESIFFLTSGMMELDWFRYNGKYFDEDLSRMIDNKFNMTAENKVKAGTEIRKIYTEGNFDDDLGAVIKFLSEEGFSIPAIRHADLQSAYSDVYLYQFSYKGVLIPFNETVEGTDTVGHTEEMLYLWDFHFADFNMLPPSDSLAHRRLLKLWTDFVKHLNPTPAEDELLENVMWPKVSSESLSYLNIGNSLEVKEGPKHYKEYKPIIEEYAIPPLANF